MKNQSYECNYLLENSLKNISKSNETEQTKSESFKSQCDEKQHTDKLNIDSSVKDKTDSTNDKKGKTKNFLLYL